MTKRWTMADVKSKGIHVDQSGKGRKLSNPVKKAVTQSQIAKALMKAKTKSAGKYDVDGKSFIHFYLQSLGIPFETEYLFWPGRKFRFDFCIPTLLLAIEFDGLMSAKSRHTTLTGYSQDAVKTNEAAARGWKVYRYTVLTFKNIANDLNYLKNENTDKQKNISKY